MYEESAFVEFKTGVGTKTVAESAVALANQEGGLVFFGVRDDGVLTGKQAGASLEDKIHDAMRTVEGRPRYDVFRLDVDGYALPVLAVWPLEEGVAQTADGRVLVRDGTRDVPLMGNRLVTFITARATRRHLVERQPTDWRVEDADPTLVEHLEHVRGWRDWQDRRLGDRVGFCSDGRLTIAGAMFLRHDPEIRLGRVFTEILRFSDDEALEYDLRREITGTAAEQLLTVEAIVRELVGFEMAFRDARRVEIPRLPARVIRETIANAIAHRSYEQAGSCISVEIRPGLVRVLSPGGLPAGVTVEDLRQAQVSRNPVILEQLRLSDLAEQRGMGIDVIEDQMQAAMLDRPRFVDRGHRFDVELPLHSTVSLDERAWVRVLTEENRLRAGDAVLLVQATRGEELTNARAQDLIGASERHARLALQRLCDAGLLVRRGARGGTTYLLAPDHLERVESGLDDDALDGLIINLTVERGSVTNADVRAAARIDRATALAAFDRLVGAGKLVREGERRGTKYRASRGVPT
jgi:ATP-dependent DNA helicase RecG